MESQAGVWERSSRRGKIKIYVIFFGKAGIQCFLSMVLFAFTPRPLYHPPSMTIDTCHCGGFQVRILQVRRITDGSCIAIIQNGTRGFYAGSNGNWVTFYTFSSVVWCVRSIANNFPWIFRVRRRTPPTTTWCVESATIKFIADILVRE